MTDRETLYSGLSNAAWGYFLLHFNFNLGFNGVRINILPEFAGFLLLLSAIVLRCIWVGRHASSPFSAYVCMGMAGMLLSQITFNVGMCLYVLPVMGLTLPFVSSGGSSIITLFAAMGLVSSVKARPMPSWLRDRSKV